MCESSKGRLAAVLSSGAAILLAGLSAGCAGHSAGTSGRGALTRHRSSSHTPARQAADRARTATRKGGIAPGALSCSGPGPNIGAVGVVKSGQAPAAEQALGDDLVAQAADSVSGQLMFFTLGAFGLKLSTYFSKIDMVSAQAEAPQLHSCDMMLGDRPAAKPVIAAAERALVNAHLVASLSVLKSELQEVLLADNVLQADSVIVTVQVAGTKRAPIAPGGPPTYSLAAFTVVMDFPSHKVTAVARGGL
jgi:hypothetical protein